MSGNLKNAVSRGVADGFSRPDVFLSKLRDDFRAGRMTIAENPRQLCACAKLGDDLRRERGLRVGKIMPVLRHRRARDFPVARRRIFAGGNFGSAGVTAFRYRTVQLEPRRYYTTGEPASFAEPKARQIRYLQRALP